MEVSEIRDGWEGFKERDNFTGGTKVKTIFTINSEVEEFLQEKLEEIGISFGANWSWGWLVPENMGEKADVWTIHFPVPMVTRFKGSFEVVDYKEKGYHRISNQEGFAEVVTPKDWNGNIVCILTRTGPEVPCVLVGRDRGSQGPSYWFSGCKASRVPEWPELGPGKTGRALRYQVRMLGVMRRGDERYEARSELFVAWAGPKGDFFGWEKVANMEAVYAMEPLDVFETQVMNNYLRFETQLREESWGRGL